MSVTHVAGLCIFFDEFMRQRCAWCSEVLVEYNLSRVAVPIGQDPTPAHWPVEALVRVDGNMSTIVEVTPDERGYQLPDDACFRNPLTVASLT
jgi:hypothetical protein